MNYKNLPPLKLILISKEMRHYLFIYLLSSESVDFLIKQAIQAYSNTESQYVWKRSLEFNFIRKLLYTMYIPLSFRKEQNAFVSLVLFL